MRASSAGPRVTYAMLGGAAAGAVTTLFTVPSASVLLDWDVAVVIYLIWTWGAVWRLAPGVTAQLAKQEDPSTAVAEFVVVGAGTAMLGAVGFALVKAGQATGGMKAYLVTLGLLSVTLSWTGVHTVFALRYARAYYSEPGGGIEFNEEGTAELHRLRLLLLYRRDDVPGGRHQHHLEGDQADDPPSRLAFLPVRRGPAGPRYQRGGDLAALRPCAGS
jgi:uncharacterized membrane protein